MSKRSQMKKTGATGFLLLTCLYFFLSASAKAQSAVDDSALYRKSISRAISIYHLAVAEQAGLFNGSQYANYPFHFAEDGFPYFKDPKAGRGSVTYDGILYENLHLQYDEVQEVVMMEDSARRIQLLNQRISEFTVFDNLFIRIVKDSTTRPLIRTGFYNVLYAGRHTLLKKEEKIVREEVGRDEILHFIDVNRYYYVKNDNDWYSIKTKNGILNLFRDRKKELRQYIRKNNLSYKKDRDNMLIKVTAYYDQLTK